MNANGKQRPTQYRDGVLQKRLPTTQTETAPHMQGDRQPREFTRSRGVKRLVEIAMHHDDDARASSFHECCQKYRSAMTQHHRMPTNSIDRPDVIMSEWWCPTEDNALILSVTLQVIEEILLTCETIWTEQV